MAKYRALVSHIAHGQIEHTAVDGVIEMPDEELHLFAALVECGWLVAIPDESGDPLVVVAPLAPAPELAPKPKRGKRG